MNTAAERERENEGGDASGGGRVALQFYKYTDVLTNTHPDHVHTVTPFSIPQEKGEWEMTEREREREGCRES